MTDSPASWYDRAYRKNAHYRSPYWESRYYFLWSVISDRIRRLNNPIVLDVGCGTGQLGQQVTEQATARYAGFDFSNEAITHARAACAHGEFWVGDARSPENYAGEWNVIVCTEVLDTLLRICRWLMRFLSARGAW